MPITLAQWLVALAGLYAVLGLVFAVPFVLRGAAAVDPGAREGTWGFRLLIFPGVVAFWPLLAHRWRHARELPGTLPEESNPHRRAARTAIDGAAAEDTP